MLTRFVGLRWQNLLSIAQHISVPAVSLEQTSIDGLNMLEWYLDVSTGSK